MRIQLPSSRRARLLLAGGACATLVGSAVVYAATIGAVEAAPENDGLASATVVDPIAVTFEGTTSGATTEADEGGSAPTVWFSWTPEGAGTTYLISDGQTTPDVKVWTGDDYPLTEVATTDAEGAATFEATAGTTYRIQVLGDPAAPGRFRYTLWQTNAGGPPNDEFAAAISLDAAVNANGESAGELTTGTTTAATKAAGEPGSGTRSVWYSWVVPNDGASLAIEAPGVGLGAYTIDENVPEGEEQGLYESLVVATPEATGAITLTGDVDQRVFLRVEGPQVDFTLTGTVSGLVPPDTTPPVIDCDVPGGWHKNARVACTATDADSGLAAPDTDAAFELVADVPEGTASPNTSTDTRSVCDVAGNCASAGPIDGIALDKAPPGITCDPLPTNWQSGDVTVTCTASDVGSGLADPATESFTLGTSTAEGVVEEEAPLSTHEPVCDAVGNCSDVPVNTPVCDAEENCVPGPAVAKVDRAVPTFTCADAPTGWQRDNVTIKCSATDEGSGFAGGETLEFDLVTSVPEAGFDAAAGTGTTSLCDLAGSCVDAGPVDGLQIDRTLPLVACEAPPEWTRGTTVEIACTAADTGSGLAATDESFTLTATIPAGSQDASVLTGDREVCDLAGNCAIVPRTVGIGLDDKPPAIRCQSAPEVWVNADVVLECTADDGDGSGLAEADHLFTVTAAVADGTVAEGVVPDPREVCDAVGNCTTTPAFVPARVDRVLPAVSCGQKPTGTSPVEVVLTCTASDQGSGLADPANASFTLSTTVGPGNSDGSAETGTRQVCDVAGNCITAGPVTGLSVDRTQPAPGGDPVLDAPSVVHVLAARPESTQDVGVAGLGSVPVPFDLPTATSEVGVAVGCTPDPTGMYPLGTTTVHCSARDAADRTADATFPVQVEAAPELAPAGDLPIGGPVPVRGTGFVGQVALEFDGVPIGTMTPDGGAVASSFAPAPGTTPGAHLVVLRGTAADGQPLLVVMPITLVGATIPPTPGWWPAPIIIGGNVLDTTPGLVLAGRPARDRTAPFTYAITGDVTNRTNCTGNVKLVTKAQFKVRTSSGTKLVRKVVSTALVPVSVSRCRASYALKLGSTQLQGAVVTTNGVELRVVGKYLDASGKVWASSTTRLWAK